MTAEREIEEVEILFVEDSAVDAELTMRALQKAGVANRMFWVQDGQEALDYLFREGRYAGRAPAAPRLVLLDLNMPKIGGMDVLQAIKQDERTRRIPVVVMTASREEKDLFQTYNLGVNSYVVKPMDFLTLCEITRQAGYYWLAINRTPDMPGAGVV